MTDHEGPNVCRSCEGAGKVDPLDGGELEECYGCDGAGIDCKHTDELVCPYCGKEDSDSWEWGSSEGEHEGETDCGSCGKTFFASRHIAVSYSTSRIAEPTPAEKGRTE